MRIELFDARMLAPLIHFLESNGARSEKFLNRARISGEVIEAGGWVAKKQAYDFTFDVVRRTDCPSAVFAAYCDFQFEHLGPIARAMQSCKTVKEALELGTRLGSRSYEGNSYFLEIDGDTTWFCYCEPRQLSAGNTYINDMTLTVYCQLIRTLVDFHWQPQQLRIRQERIDRHRSLPMFEECEAEVHPVSSGIAFPTEFLSRRAPWWNRTLEFDATTAWATAPEGCEPPADAIYRLVASSFPYRTLPTLDEVALMVDISAATLKRQLRSAGMNYTRLLDRLRFDSACEMLSDSRMTMRDIALELGYSGANNFIRSFRRMTGLTPGEYRQKNDDENS